jgi:hypothetical protein
MKLVNLCESVLGKLELTSLNMVFDIQEIEASAIKSFVQPAGAIAQFRD